MAEPVQIMCLDKLCGFYSIIKWHGGLSKFLRQLYRVKDINCSGMRENELCSSCDNSVSGASGHWEANPNCDDVMMPAKWLRWMQCIADFAPTKDRRWMIQRPSPYWQQQRGLADCFQTPPLLLKNNTCGKKDDSCKSENHKKDSCESKKDSCKSKKDSCKSKKDSSKSKKESCESKKDSCKSKKDSCKSKKDSSKSKKDSCKSNDKDEDPCNSEEMMKEKEHKKRPRKKKKKSSC